MATLIALLRGINVSGRNRVPMADLRALCDRLGYGDVRTYVNSGNVVFTTAGDGPSPTAAVEARLEAGIVDTFGLEIPVVVRTATQWPDYLAANPFPEASAADPHLVLLGLSKAPPVAGAVEALRARATAGERIDAVGDGIWFHYAAGVGGSKLSPAVIDRAVGSPLTARNWNTVRRLAEIAEG